MRSLVIHFDGSDVMGKEGMQNLQEFQLWYPKVGLGVYMLYTGETGGVRVYESERREDTRAKAMGI